MNMVFKVGLKYVVQAFPAAACAQAHVCMHTTSTLGTYVGVSGLEVVAPPPSLKDLGSSSIVMLANARWQYTCSTCAAAADASAHTQSTRGACYTGTGWSGPHHIGAADLYLLHQTGGSSSVALACVGVTHKVMVLGFPCLVKLQMTIFLRLDRARHD